MNEQATGLMSSETKTPLESDEPRLIDAESNEFWEQNKKSLVPAVIVLVLAIIGYTGYQVYAHQQASKARVAFVEATEEGDFQAVLDQYGRTPSAPFARLRLAKLAREAGNDDEVLRHLEAFLSDYADHPLVSAVEFSYAEALMIGGKKDEARELYRGISSRPANTAFRGGATLALAKVYLEEENYDEARLLLTTMIEEENPSMEVLEGQRLLSKLPKVPLPADGQEGEVQSSQP